MAIEFVCPGCRNRLRVPDEHAGKQAQCPECLQISQVPYLSVDGQPLAGEPPVVTGAPGPGPDPRLGPVNPYAAPQATSPSPAAYLRPHRGAMLLVLGVLSICCCNLLGIAPIVMATADLAAMERGEMDPSGSGLTQAARVLGIVALVLMVFAVALRVIMGAAHG